MGSPGAATIQPAQPPTTTTRDHKKGRITQAGSKGAGGCKVAGGGVWEGEWAVKEEEKGMKGSARELSLKVWCGKHVLQTVRLSALPSVRTRPKTMPACMLPCFKKFQSNKHHQSKVAIPQKEGSKPKNTHPPPPTHPKSCPVPSTPCLKSSVRLFFFFFFFFLFFFQM